MNSPHETDDTSGEEDLSIPAPTQAAGAAEPTDIDAAAKVLAACMDYPWEHMPEQGRAQMRKHAQAVVAAASTATAPSAPTEAISFTKDPAMTNDTHHSEVLTSIDAEMLALANRIAASCAPDDERGDIAIAIARHLNLGWPAAATHHDTGVCDAAYQSAISEVAALKTKLGVYTDWCDNMNTGPIEHF